MDYRDQDFSGVAVHLDGNTFVRCTFDNAILHYAGTPIVMDRCHFNLVVWAFEGPVAQAIGVIRDIYHTEPETAVKVWRTAMFGDGETVTIV